MPNIPKKAEAEFNEFKPRRWTVKNRFHFDLETLNKIFSGTN